MQQRRRGSWLSILLIAALALLLPAGCAPRAGAGETAAAAAPDALVVDLPALDLTFDANGVPSMGDTPVADLLAGFGVSLDSLALPADTVQQFMNMNVQHIQVSNSPGGLRLFVNGQAIPSLAFTGDSLQATVDALAPAMPMLGSVGELLPILTQLGIGATLRFPVQEGAEALPLMAPAGESAAALDRATDEFAAGVGSPGVIRLPITYNPDGTFRIMGMGSDAWQRILPDIPWDRLVQRPEQMATAQKLGLKTLTLSTSPAGLKIIWNGAELPYGDWADGKLMNLLSVLNTTGLAGPSVDLGALQPLLDRFLPMILGTDIQIEARFP